jgi:hypothetical protein
MSSGARSQLSVNFDALPPPPNPLSPSTLLRHAHLQRGQVRHTHTRRTRNIWRVGLWPFLRAITMKFFIVFSLLFFFL